MNTIAPAQLWIGSAQHSILDVIDYLQKLFCSNHGCGTCTTCRSIAQQQHINTTWLATSKQYTLDQMDIILHTASFALEHNSHHFFIIQRADLLSTACANRLLKIVEEPPAGYHFIFLTSRLHAILPTIRSRCTTKLLAHQDAATTESALVGLFKKPDTLVPATFMRLLDQENPHEQTTLEMIDELFSYWMHQQKKSPNNKTAAHMLRILQHALAEPPMPGGSKIFWRNFYLQSLGAKA